MCGLLLTPRLINDFVQVARFVGAGNVYAYLWGCFHDLHGVVRTHHMKQSWPQVDELNEYSIGNGW